MSKPTIILTTEDALCAASVATLQILRKLQNGRTEDHGGRSKRSLRLRFADGIMGCMGEIAIARYRNQVWTPGGMTVSRGDISWALEARHTEYENGHLLIYKKDPDDKVIFLITGQFPALTIVGSLLAGEGKKDEFWNANADPPCWWVPQAMLDDPEK